MKIVHYFYVNNCRVDVFENNNFRIKAKTKKSADKISDYIIKEKLYSPPDGIWVFQD